MQLVATAIVKSIVVCHFLIIHLAHIWVELQIQERFELQVFSFSSCKWQQTKSIGTGVGLLLYQDGVQFPAVPFSLCCIYLFKDGILIYTIEHKHNCICIVMVLKVRSRNLGYWVWEPLVLYYCISRRGPHSICRCDNTGSGNGFQCDWTGSSMRFLWLCSPLMVQRLKGFTNKAL